MVKTLNNAKIGWLFILSTIVAVNGFVLIGSFDHLLSNLLSFFIGVYFLGFSINLILKFRIMPGIYFYLRKLYPNFIKPKKFKIV